MFISPAPIAIICTEMAKSPLQHQPKAQPITKVQRDLWFELNTTIRECGGWTVSQPDVWPLRFEVQVGSDLPEILKALGHSVRYLGTHERLMPVVETITEHGSARKVV